jgi:hypothetical protein
MGGRGEPTVFHRGPNPLSAALVESDLEAIASLVSCF